MEGRQLRPAWRIGVLGLGIGAPLIVHALELGGECVPRRMSALAALATLAGGFILRVVLIFGGKASARRPEDYLRQMAGGR
jgi:formate-dependent nitrite reductase membrane component NrfD